MKERSAGTWALTALLLVLGSGCATSRSDIEGRLDAPGSPGARPTETKVRVLFVLKHARQAEGLDQIPKLDGEGEIIRDFDDLFLDAITELSNIESYATFTEFASDVSKPERRERRDELIAASDFVVRIDFMRRHSSIRHFLGYIASSISLTLVPVPYSRFFSIGVEVQGADGERIETYARSASLTTWVQMFLIFLQPFHQEPIKKERIYLELLHDVFSEMESDGALAR